MWKRRATFIASAFVVPGGRPRFLVSVTNSVLKRSALATASATRWALSFIAAFWNCFASSSYNGNMYHHLSETKLGSTRTSSSTHQLVHLAVPGLGGRRRARAGCVGIAVAVTIIVVIAAVVTVRVTGLNEFTVIFVAGVVLVIIVFGRRWLLLLHDDLLHVACCR